MTHDLHPRVARVAPHHSMSLARTLPRLPRLSRISPQPPQARPLLQARTMSHKPEILSTETFDTDAKWLRLQRIKYRDQEGKERFWEVANRSTRKGAVDSVHILALVKSAEGRGVVLIEQYRPPVAATVVEFPAGLLDEGEDPATTALRELHEETGYHGQGVTVKSVSPVMVKDPGMTGANMHLVTVEIDLPPNAPPPQPKPDDGEHIVQRVVPLKDLDAALQDYEKRGFAIDALVQSVATGLGLAG